MGRNSQFQQHDITQEKDIFEKQKSIYVRSMREIFRLEVEEEYAKALAILRQMQMKKWDFPVDDLRAKTDKILKLLWLDKALKNIHKYLAEQNYVDAHDLLQRILDRCCPGELPMKFLDRIEKAKEKTKNLQSQLQQKHRSFLHLVALCGTLSFIALGCLFLINPSLDKSHFPKQQIRKLMAFQKKLDKAKHDKNILLKASKKNKRNDKKSLVVSWKIKDEVDLMGFHIWRSEKENGGYTRITRSLIVAKGVAQSNYSYRDRHIKRTQDYFYKIEKVNSNGNSSFFNSF